MEVGDGGRLYTYRYTVTTRMIPALKWAAITAILKFLKLWGTKSQDGVHNHMQNESPYLWRRFGSHAPKQRLVAQRAYQTEDTVVPPPSLQGYAGVDNNALGTFRASLSGTFLQTLPDLVTPLKGHSLSPRSCPATWSAPSERFGY